MRGKIQSLRSFSGGCCDGIDGLHPAHLVADSTAEAGLHLRRSMTNLTKEILRRLRCQAPFSSTLTTLKKKNGGIRPGAFGNVFRHLAAKVGCYTVSRAMLYELSPIQLGVSVKGCAKAAVHAVRRFITNKIGSDDPKIIVKLDTMNAFNPVRHDHDLQTCLDHAPVITKLSFLDYSKPSSVIVSGHSITSSTGVQQGDQVSPLLLAFAVDQISCQVESQLNVWYFDDATISGSPESFLSDVQRCITELKLIGLEVNPNKTELTNIELLGSPILNDATRFCIVRILSEYKRMNDRILLLDGHPGLFMLKNAASLLFPLRCAPCHHNPELLDECDEVTHSTTEELCSIYFDDNSWSQAKLPVRYGGLGLRTAADLALPAFLSSRAASIS